MEPMAKPIESLSHTVDKIDDGSIDDRLLSRHKNNIIKELGHTALDSDKIDDYGKKNFKEKWGGCEPWNKIKIAPNKYYVINTSASDGVNGPRPGIHWVAMVTTEKTAYIWDSYNRSINKLLPRLVRSLKKHKFKLGVTYHPMDQIGTSSQVCGQLSLSWLMTVKDVGIQRAMQV